LLVVRKNGGRWKLDWLITKSRGFRRLEERWNHL
jgi:hypothetical protein